MRDCKYLRDVFAAMGVNGADTPKYVNLLKASVGCDAQVFKHVAASWLKLNAVAVARNLYAEHDILRMQQILLGVLCLRWAWDESFVYVDCRRNLLNADFFEFFADPDNYASVAPGLRLDVGRCEDIAVFIQGFYNLIAATGHVITAEHMQMTARAFDLINEVDEYITAQQDAYRLPRRFRFFNRRVVKNANIKLGELFPAYPFRVFQQDYDADGILAYNATLYHDFTLPEFGFVLDCRLETDLTTNRAAVSVVLFSRAHKERFTAEFARHEFLMRLGFVFYADTPNGPCWVRHQATNLDAADADMLTDVIVAEIAEVMPALPL